MKNPEVKSKSDPDPILSSSEERMLVDWVISLAKKGFPRKKKDIICSVQNFLQKNPRKNAFKNDRPGDGWYKTYLKRNSNLTERISEGVTYASSCVSESDIRGWFKEINDYIKPENLEEVIQDSSRVFNGDETNFQICPASGKVLAEKGSINVYDIERVSSKDNITVMFTFSADGKVCNPMIVYAYGRVPERISQSVPNNWGIGKSDNGWMTSEVFYDYVANVLHPQLIKDGIVFPIVFFVDGHKTHLTYQWQATLLNLCLLAQWTHQLTQQQLYEQFNKQQQLAQHGGKLQLYGQFNKQPLLLGQQVNKHQQLLAQFSSQQPFLLGQQPLSGHLPVVGQLSSKQQQLMLQQQQLAMGSRLRPRWAGAYKPYYNFAKAPQQIYRIQKPNVKMPYSYGQGTYNAPINFRTNAVKDGYRNPLTSSPLMASSAYPFHAGNSLNALTGQIQTHKLLGSPPYKFASVSQHKNILSAVIPTKSFLSFPSQSQNFLSSTHTPPVPSSVPSPIHSNTFVQSQQNVASDDSHGFIPGNVVSTSSQVFPGSAIPHRTTVYPIKSEGERGPIHTIPAPNLSLADKPIVVPENSNNYAFSHPSYSNNQFKGTNTYEVTEDTNDKTYKNPYTGETKLFAPDPNPSQQSTKLTPIKNFYPSVIKHLYPHETAFKVQSVTPSLTSQDLFQLMNGGYSQQQLADTYNFPLLQQPQLQQHFLQQTLDTSVPLQPFNAVIQPTHGDQTNFQQNVLFKPDPKYLQKIQEQYLKQSSVFQPNFHSFNYEEPTHSQGVEALQNEALKASFENALNEAQESRPIHYNIIRKTNEGVPSLNNFSDDNQTQSKSRELSESRDTFNIQTSVNFIPTILPEIESKGFSESSPLTASYFTQVSDPDSGSVSANYYSSLPNSEVADTLATLQAANNLINEAQKYHNNHDAVNLHSHFIQNTIPSKSQYTIDHDSESGFRPIKSSQFSVQTEENETPIRIYVPDQYDDIETQPSQNIQVSASLNANQNAKDVRIYNSDETHNSNGQQDYEDYSQHSEVKQNSTFSAPEDNQIKLPEENPSSSNDVIVTTQKNVTNPTLDVTTDWKTSVANKVTEKDVSTGQNQISEFGNRITPKRDE